MLFEIYCFHLGFSSWITYTDGSPVQYLSYLPFGETSINHQRTDWSARYTFSGKEKDEETGFHYFGARYYDSDLSIWLSVDPMAGARPWSTPYAYCQNNPIGKVDPNGMLDDWYQNDNGQLLWSSESKDAISFGGSTYNNIAKGDNLPANLQTNSGINLIISGHKTGDELNDAWDTQATYINNGNPNTNNAFAIANNKDDLIKAFEVTTSNFGQVNNAAIRSHGWDLGLTLGGSREDGFRYSDIGMFSSRLSNTIIMGKNASIYFLGCDNAPLSQRFANSTGITSYGAYGNTGPADRMGGFNSTMEGYYRHGKNSSSSWQYVGPTINVRF